MLTTTVSGALKERYRHFNFDLCSGAFSPEQPPGGRVLVPVQGHFGAAWMANGVTWFYERDRRPKRGDGRPMKAKAPRGFRPFLGAPAETMVVLVEGEGDYIAACSVGLKGAVCTGGTRALLGKGMRAAIARLVDGRDAYLLFDPDREGREYALQCARRIFACGRPLSVRIVELPADKDLEEFLAAFEDPGAARAALEELMAATPAVEAEDVEALLSGENLQRVHALQRRVRIPGSKVPALVVTVYDAERDRAQLAAFAPPECFESGNPGRRRTTRTTRPSPGRRTWRWARTGGGSSTPGSSAAGSTCPTCWATRSARCATAAWWCRPRSFTRARTTQRNSGATCASCTGAGRSCRTRATTTC